MHFFISIQMAAKMSFQFVCVYAEPGKKIHRQSCKTKLRGAPFDFQRGAWKLGSGYFFFFFVLIRWVRQSFFFGTHQMGEVFFFFFFFLVAPVGEVFFFLITFCPLDSGVGQKKNLPPLAAKFFFYTSGE